MQRNSSKLVIQCYFSRSDKRGIKHITYKIKKNCHEKNIYCLSRRPLCVKRLFFLDLSPSARLIS